MTYKDADRKWTGAKVRGSFFPRTVRLRRIAELNAAEAHLDALKRPVPIRLSWWKRVLLAFRRWRFSR